MNDEQKSKEELIQELKALRHRVAELESTVPLSHMPQRALQTSENHLNTLVNVLPGRAVVLDANGIYLDVIKQNHFASNFQPKDVIGKSLYDVQPEEFANFCMAKMREVLESDTVHIFEYSFFNVAGDFVYHEGHVAPLHDNETGQAHIIWVSRDITKRKRTEIALRESEERLQTFVNALPDRAVIISEKGIYLDVVKHRQDTNSYQSSDVIGKSLHDVQIKEFADFCVTTIQKALDTGEMQVIEYDLVNQIGLKVYYEGRISPLRTEPGEEPRVLWISRDVTKRKENEQAVIKSEKRLRTFVDLLPDRAVVMDTGGGYVDVIKLRAHTTVEQPVDTADKSIYDFAPADFADFCVATIKDVLEANETRVIEYDVITDGVQVFYEGRITPWTVDDNPHVLWVSRDITDRKETEQAWKASEERLRTFVNLLPDRAVVINNDGRYVSLVKRGRNTALKQSEDIIGKTLHEVLSESFADFCLTKIHEVLEKDEIQVIEYDSIQDGIRVYHEGRIAPWKIGDNDTKQVLWVSRDITDRKETEQALKESEERLRTFVEMLPDRAVVINEEGRYINLIKQHTRTRLPQPDNVPGKTVFDIFPSHFAEFCMEKIHETLEKNQMQAIEYDVVTKTGLHVFYEGRIAPWHVGDTDERRILWISRDITDRKETERALVESEQRLRTFVEMLPDRAVVINEEGRYVSLIKLASNTIIEQPDDVVDKTLHDILPLEFADFCLAKIHEVLEKDEMQVIEYDFMEDDTRVYYAGRIAPWKIAGDDTKKVLWITRDITDRKETERALVESEERLRTFVDILPDRAVVINEEGRYVSLIKQHIRTRLPPPDDVIGKKLTDVYPDEFANFCLGKIRETLETDEMQTIEYSITTKTGLHVFYEGRIAPWNVGDAEELRILWITRDITDRKETEMELAGYRDHLETLVQERTAELEQEIAERKQLEAARIRQERLAAVGQLAAGIAHDFNNVMGVIMLDSSLVLRSPHLTEYERSKLERIQKQAQHAANLIEQILDFSRRSVREPVILDLRILLSELIKFLQRTIPERIEVAFSYTKGEFAVSADPTQFQQVITNLAVNARDAIEGNGKLSFRLEHFQLDRDVTPPIPEMTTGRWVQLDVVDTGQGIKPEHLPNIFEPFFTTKEVGKGTGLGLAQVHGIVHQHEGFITVASETGKGTTFSIYFPAAQGEATSVEQNGEMKLDRGQGETILLVEDSPDLREAISDLLQSLDYRVLTATNGEEALSIYDANRQQVKLVLSDVVMPQMDGIELVRRLKRYFPKPKIIMMSGFHQNVTITPDIESAVIAWLQKPLDISHLSEVIQQTLPGNEDRD